MGLANIMTSIADAVRRLAGREDKLKIHEMTTEINDANAEIDAQSALIAQIRQAIIGKATSGGASGGTAKVYTGTKTVESDNTNQITFQSEEYIGENDLFVAYRDKDYYSYNAINGTYAFTGNFTALLCYCAGASEGYTLTADASYSDYTNMMSMGILGRYMTTTTSITGKTIEFGVLGIYEGSWKWIHVKM